MPRVSVVIPVYNCAKTIAKAIQSVQQQTLRDIEIVAVDDCSADNSFELIQNFANSDARVKAIRLPKNGGASVARNTAIDNATGEWVAVLDADDWYEPNRLEVMLNAAEANKADFVCDNLKLYDHVLQAIVDQTYHGNGQITQLTVERCFNWDNQLRLHAIGYVKPMVKKSFLDKHHIRYDPVHISGQDFVFLAEILLNGAKAIIIPDALYVYVHRISPTTRKISPHSRSDSGFRLIVQGCDELLQKYGASMTPAERQALQRRRWIFQNRVKCDHMLAAYQHGKPAQAARIVLANPFILVLIGATLAKWIYMLARVQWKRRTGQISVAGR